MMFIPSTALVGRPAEVPETEEVLQMDQESFRNFYERTARGIWVFLLRRTGDPHLADDLLQETFYRFLRTPRDYASGSHRRNYLYRIASNAANDALRLRSRLAPLTDDTPPDAGRVTEGEADSQKRTDLARAMAQLKPREREALWLAYAEGATHEEIAEILAVKKSSIKSLLFRARKRLADRLRHPNRRRGL